jgi:hypothetical protein
LLDCTVHEWIPEGAPGAGEAAAGCGQWLSTSLPLSELAECGPDEFPLLEVRGLIQLQRELRCTPGVCQSHPLPTAAHQIRHTILSRTPSSSMAINCSRLRGLRPSGALSIRVWSVPLAASMATEGGSAGSGSIYGKGRENGL